MHRFFYFILGVLVPFYSFCQEPPVKGTSSVVERNTFTYSDTLRLDFYSEKNKENAADRPLIILVHGGGFSGGKRDNVLETQFCETMTLKGYAVVSMSYTLSRKGEKTGFGCNCPIQEKINTFKITARDILNATRYLMDKKEFSFDRNKIILAGSSAGAEGILMTAYQQQYLNFKDLPYGNSKYAAVVSLSGAIIDARYINKNNAIPAFFIHGEKDSLVPFEQAPHHYCSPEKPGYLLLDGPQAIVQKLKAQNVSYQLFSDANGNHDWANKGYQMTDEIANFLDIVVVNKGFVQQEIRIAQ